MASTEARLGWFTEWMVPTRKYRSRASRLSFARFFKTMGNDMKATRFGTRSLLLVFALLAVVFAAYGWIHRKFVMPRHYSDAVERLIETLADRRPPNMTSGQWGSAVAWTLNLHGNSLLMFEANGPTIKAFEQRLEAKLAGDVSMETIHWIWDEYANICPHGASYQRFKVQMQDEIDNVGPNDDPWGMNVP